MKKILLIPALILSLSAMASEYEFTPLIGYDIADNNTHLSNYAVVAGEVQYNDFNFPIKPEISFLYSLAYYEDDFLNYIDNADTNVMRFALNGVYEFDKLSIITPLAKAGIGYETMDSAYGGNNDGSGFIDAGIGAKIPFSDMISLKLESIYMLKYNAARYDSNILFLAGINFAFGSDNNSATPVSKKIIIEEKAPIVKEVEEKKIEIIEEIKEVSKPVITPVAKIVEKPKPVIEIVPITYEGTIEKDQDGNPKKINLGVSFQRDNHILDEVYEDDVDRFVNFLNENPEYKVEIVGYADSIGTYEYNQTLSEKRASIVKDMLIKKGISSERLITVGNGEYSPIATNMYKAGRAQNRRIEVNLIK